MYEKSLKPSSKPRKNDIEESFVQGAKATKVPKPKSLTPKGSSSRKK